MTEPMNTHMMITAVESDEQIRIVAALAAEIWNQHYGPIIGQAQVDYMLRRFQCADVIRTQIDEGQEYYLAAADGIPAGYLGLIPELSVNRLMISKLYVKDACRGSGIGARFLELANRRAKELHAESVYLRVNRYNTDTIHWYRNRGFAVAEEVKSSIGDGFYMDDYLMEYRFADAD